MINAALRPLSIGKNEIKNRFIMGSMHTGLEELPNGFEALAELGGLDFMGIGRRDRGESQVHA